MDSRKHYNGNGRELLISRLDPLPIRIERVAKLDSIPSRAKAVLIELDTEDRAKHKITGENMGLGKFLLLFLRFAPIIITGAITMDTKQILTGVAMILAAIITHYTGWPGDSVIPVLNATMTDALTALLGFVGAAVFPSIFPKKTEAAK